MGTRNVRDLTAGGQVLRHGEAWTVAEETGRLEGEHGLGVTWFDVTAYGRTERVQYRLAGTVEVP